MSFDFFFKACNFWSQNLPSACGVCTNDRTHSVSNIESLSKSSEILNQPEDTLLNNPQTLGFPPYQTSITPPTQLQLTNISPHSSKQDDSGFSANFSLNYRLSGAKKGRVWTSEEDKLLLESVRKNDGKNWKNIAKAVPGRSATQCSQRWRRIQPYKLRQKWTKDEDKLILSLVEKHGLNWCLIASMLEGRTGKQVRERYLNKLDRNINRAKFTEEDDKKIIQYYEEYGPKWKEISGHFRGRPENMIKNRFYSHIRKRILLNPENFQNILAKLNKDNYINENDLSESINSYHCNRENPQTQLLAYSNVSNPQMMEQEGNVQDFCQGNNMNRRFSEDFLLNDEKLLLEEPNIEYNNMDLDALSPNYFEENHENSQPIAENYNIERSLSGDNQLKFEEINYFETNNNNNNNAFNFSRQASDEMRKNLNNKQIELLNKKQQILEIIKNGIEEKICKHRNTNS